MEGGSIQAAAPHDLENPYVQLETSMAKEWDRLSPMSPSRCIFRVPHRLRCQRENAYTPKVISIGPLHHGNSALKAMEEHKMRYLQYFLGRTNNLSLKDYIGKIKDQEAKLRSCYSETIQLESDEFVKIILVDAIFVIEFLCRLCYAEFQNENDCILEKPYMMSDVWPDLLMLENQLPFFILEDLYSMYFDRFDGVETLSILLISCSFLANVSIFQGKFDNYIETIYSSEAEVQHFVDLLRKLCIAPILKKKQFAGQSKQSDTTAPSIEKLHLAGVEFKVGSTNNWFDIRFNSSDGILEIPKLKTDDSTELIFGNLVAFEQCSTIEELYISDYVNIMDKFVDTPKDVELLVKYGIVENVLGGGDSQLSTIINRLSNGVIYDPRNFYYAALCEDLKKFCNSKWHKSIANLRQNYFNTPWTTISFIAAVVLLILTVVQTICSIISLP